MEKRQFFRVNDVIPLILQKMPPSTSALKARIIPGLLQSSFEPVLAEDDLQSDPHLLRMLTAIDAKLNLILARLSAQDSGLTNVENYQVNLSEGGICLTLPDAYAVGDILEIKMMLSSIPYSVLLVYGLVERVQKLTEEGFEVAVTFIEMEDDVREALSRHILQRQRGMLRNQLEYLYSPDNGEGKGENAS
ncbi:conserved hypothetical protein [uncultured Desulfobacterium sp.]|uniref:PilZ domain-containing protein n=1 Tax=uncultured Desulfobacterium sp. TaxID=201089 RepID=A0A445MW61_9BACT|nr:conserved hypothetical protein [uncultured Desulfobacterium sp.]